MQSLHRTQKFQLSPNYKNDYSGGGAVGYLLFGIWGALKMVFHEHAMNVFWCYWRFLGNMQKNICMPEICRDRSGKPYFWLARPQLNLLQQIIYIDLFVSLCDVNDNICILSTAHQYFPRRPSRLRANKETYNMEIVIFQPVHMQLGFLSERNFPSSP